MDLKTRFAILSGFAATVILSCNISLAAAPATPRVVNIVLQEGGVVVGQLVDVQGAALADRQVSLYQGKQLVSLAKTDKEGRFALKGVRAGIHKLVAGKNQGHVAVWTASAAPPTAHHAVLMVSDNAIVTRAQGDGVSDAAIGGVIGGGGLLLGILALDEGS
jgi:hypothetical protein